MSECHVWENVTYVSVTYVRVSRMLVSRMGEWYVC
jgi:hypothetical protein